MGLHRLLVSILRPHCDPRSLVLVIGATSTSIELLVEELGLSTSYRPRVISAEHPTEERRNIYLKGGCVGLLLSLLFMSLVVLYAVIAIFFYYHGKGVRLEYH